MKKIIYLFTKNRRLINLCSDFLFLNRSFEKYEFYYFEDAFACEKFLNQNADAVCLDEAELDDCFEAENLADKLHRLAETDSCSENENPLLKKICGVSRKIRNFREQIIMASRCNLPVLLTGESGSGKSMAAEIIHELSDRAEEPFFSVNVASISESLIESELFGVTEGAFTDSRNRKGYFLSAGKGTLFLDEIGELKNDLQAKLLTVTETGRIRSVGSDETKLSRCRLVFATNNNLERKIKDGSFRQDLYYRISNLVIEVPSLRSRREDIAYLCRDYLASYGRTITSGAIALLETFDWPGNVRQLFACMDRAVLKSRNKSIDAEDIILQ